MPRALYAILVPMKIQFNTNHHTTLIVALHWLSLATLIGALVATPLAFLSSSAPLRAVVAFLLISSAIVLRLSE
jgi:hypothetical protein